MEQIEEDIARLKTRLEHIEDSRLRRIVLADIARLKARRSTELLRIVRTLREHDDLARRLELVLSVPGIGQRTALALIVRMPELGRISREQAAALAGLAPFDDDSGKYKGQRHIAGGRGRLRRSLYAAALAAAFHWNKALIELYARLTARGKAHNAALVACARKLLIYANTVVARGTPWTTRPQPVSPSRPARAPTPRAGRGQGWPLHYLFHWHGLDRPRLDRGEHGVNLQQSGPPDLMVAPGRARGTS